MTTHPHLEGRHVLERLAAIDPDWMERSCPPGLLRELIADSKAALAALPGGGVDDARFTLRELTQALALHYKETTGDPRHVPATQMAFETVNYLIRHVQNIREASPTPTPHEADRNG